MYLNPLTSGSRLTFAGKPHIGSQKIVLVVPLVSSYRDAWSRTSIPPLAGS